MAVCARARYCVLWAHGGAWYWARSGLSFWCWVDSPARSPVSVRRWRPGVADQVFEMSWTPTPLMWVLGPTLGAVIVGALGVWSCRRVVNVPPVVILREV